MSEQGRGTETEVEFVTCILTFASQPGHQTHAVYVLEIGSEVKARASTIKSRRRRKGKVLPEGLKPTPRRPAECAAINSVQFLCPSTSSCATTLLSHLRPTYSPDVAQRVCASTVLQEPDPQPHHLDRFQIVTSIEERCGTKPGRGRSSGSRGRDNGSLKSSGNTAVLCQSHRPTSPLGAAGRSYKGLLSSTLRYIVPIES